MQLDEYFSGQEGLATSQRLLPEVLRILTG